VTAGCHEALKRTGQLQTFDAGMYFGILKGLHYLSKNICIAPAISLGQIGEVVSQYFDSRAAGITRDSGNRSGRHAFRVALRREKEHLVAGPRGWIHSAAGGVGRPPADARWSHPNH
jgi:hypothetical protein